MKIIATVILAGALLPAALFAGAFEGKVTMKMSSSKEKTTSSIRFCVKEGLTRIETSAKADENATIIMNVAKQEVIILMDSEKMYMVQALPKPGAQAQGKGAAATIEKTTITEKILGYDTVKYITKDKKTTTEIWVTDQLGTFMGMGSDPSGPMGGGHRGGDDQAWARALEGKEVFPLRVVTSAGTKESFRMEATSIEKVSLPASTFLPPAGYKKFDMAAMMGGMMGDGK